MLDKSMTNKDKVRTKPEHQVSQTSCPVGVYMDGLETNPAMYMYWPCKMSRGCNHSRYVINCTLGSLILQWIFANPNLASPNP